MSNRPNPADNPDNQYAIGRRVKVRKLQGEYRVVDTRMVGKNRRYELGAIPGTGAALLTTEAWGTDMRAVPDPEPAPELSLAPDPVPGTDAQEHASPAEHTEPAPVAEPAAADAIRSPDTYEPGTFGGELDPYSPGANQTEKPAELQNPFKPVRKWPQRPSYRELKGIVYNARFKGLEDYSSTQLATLQEGTPIAVIVTNETNGQAIWITVTESADEVRSCYLEQFYPEANGSRADAIEYAVLLALRQVPIRSRDLEALFEDLS
jgi:hypothetical protein